MCLSVRTGCLPPVCGTHPVCAELICQLIKIMKKCSIWHTCEGCDLKNRQIFFWDSPVSTCQLDYIFTWGTKQQPGLWYVSSNKKKNKLWSSVETADTTHWLSRGSVLQAASIRSLHVISFSFSPSGAAPDIDASQESWLFALWLTRTWFSVRGLEN